METLNRRIKELQKFKKANEYLITKFEKDLDHLKKWRISHSSADIKAFGNQEIFFGINK